MSINNIANSVFPNTLSGLDSLNVTNITINGVDVSSLYVPFTNAPSNVDLNNKNLTGVNNVGTTTLVSSGLVQGGSFTTTGLTTTNTLKISTVAAGTQSSLLAIDASGNVIVGTSPTPTQITVNKGAVTGVPYYLTFVPTNTSLPQPETMYTEGYVNGYELQYFPNSQTLTVLNMSIQGQITVPNLPLSTFPSAYIAINASNQLIRTASVSAQPTITQLSASGTYYPIFVNSNSAQSGATVYVDGATNPLSYSFNGQVLTAKNLTVTGTTTIVGYAPLASPAFTGIPTAPTAGLGTNTTQVATTEFVTSAVSGITGYIKTTGTTTGVDNILKLNGTSAQFIIQSSTGGTLFSVRQSATPYVGIDSLNVTNALAVGTTGSFGGALTCSSDVTVGGKTYTTSIAGSLLADLVINQPGGGKSIIFQYGGNPTITINNSGTLISNSGFIQADAGATALILGVQGSSSSNLTLSTTSANFNAPIQASYVDGTANDGVGIWVSSGGTQCSSIVLTDAFGKTMGTATPTTSFGRYFAVGGGVYQDFYGTFRWRATNTIGASSWATVSELMRLTTSNLTLQMGSMNNFSAFGSWDGANCLCVTTGGVGGSNSGVGMGFSTTDGTGYLVSIAPGNAWRPMTYKANNHAFLVNGNTEMAGVNTTGFYLSNAGYMTNSIGAGVAGLSGYSAGDLIFYANSSGVMRFYNGSTCRFAVGANNVYLDTIRAFSASTGTQLQNDSGFSVVSGGGSLYFTVGTAGCYFYVNGSQSAFNSNSIYSPALGGYTGRGFFLTASGGASCNPAICHAWNSPGAGSSGSTYCTTLANASQYTVYLPNPVSGIYGFSYNWGSTGFGFPSDIRLKDNIEPIPNGKESFMKLKPCQYHYKSDDDKKRRFGFIAQELQEVYPDAVYESEITEKDKDGTEFKPLLLTQTYLIPFMVDQIQVLHRTVDDQQAKIDLLLKHLSDLTVQVNELTKQMKKNLSI